LADLDAKLHELWAEFKPRVAALENEFMGCLEEFIAKPTSQVTDETAAGQAGQSPEGDGGAGPTAAEATRTNEDRKGEDKNGEER